MSRALHLHRSQPHARYFQLATVTPEGRPANRTVVFRGFLESTNQLKIITDLRSAKIAHIKHQPWVEACWYFSKTREQFRFKGTCSLVGVDNTNSIITQTRKKTWQNISAKAKSQFTWPTPGELRSDNEPVIVEPDAETAPSETLTTSPSPNFCLLLLNPEEVDYLELKGEPHARWLYYLDDTQTWHISRINP